MKMVVEVLVEFDYVAKEPDELSIKCGDIIRDVICRKGGWWEGYLGNRRGVFPDNYVKLLVPSDTPATMRNKCDSHRVRKCRVVFSYCPAHEDELPLNVDDVVNIIGEEEEGWWRGTLHGREGVFPSNFVEEIAVKGKSSKSGSRESLNDLEADLMVKSPVLPPKPDRLFEVTYAYTAENEDELSLCEGDVVTLISKEGQDPGWWRGELNGRTGVFPDNFVIPLQNKNNTQVLDQRTSITSGNTATNKQTAELERIPTPPTTLTVLPVNIKPSHIVQQRKCLDQKQSNAQSSIQSEDNAVKGAIPPVLGKKPTVPKKSPSGSGSAGGLFAGIKKKLADAVDGAAGSKSFSKDSKSSSEDGPVSADSAFDQVERNSMLPDVRASRAKAPRRRPPSVVFKDSTPPPTDQQHLTNGNTSTGNDNAALTSSVVSSSSGGSLDMLPELDAGGVDTNATMEEQQGHQQTPITAVRPKVREWEKHKAPWLEEMKASQAKRTSTSPGPEKRSGGGKQQTPDGCDTPVTAIRTSKDTLIGSPASPQRTSLPQTHSTPNNNTSPASAFNISAPVNIPATPTASAIVGIDMSRSMPALSSLLRATGAEVVADKPILRSQLPQSKVGGGNVVASSVVSAAIRTSVPVTVDVKQKAGVPPTATTPPSSVLSVKLTPPPKPMQHSPLTLANVLSGADRDVQSASGDAAVSRIASADSPTSIQQPLITELLDRLDRLEKESQMNKAAIDDLRGKLQVETDLRRLLQAELDKVSRCMMQV